MNSTHDIDILKAITEVKLGDQTITIKELAWPDALALLNKLASHAGKFITTDGKFVLTTENVATIVTGSQDISEWLMTKATGKDTAWLATLTFDQALTVLDAAISANIRPDFFVKAERIGQRINAVFGLDKSKNPPTPPLAK